MSSNKINDLKKSETFKNHAKVWKIQYMPLYIFSFPYAIVNIRDIKIWFIQKMLGKKMSIGGDDFIKAADEAFDMLDMDGNGTIERGDIE